MVKERYDDESTLIKEPENSNIYLNDDDKSQSSNSIS